MDLERKKVSMRLEDKLFEEELKFDMLLLYRIAHRLETKDNLEFAIDRFENIRSNCMNL
jgi:hypothetical protein